MLGAAEGLVNDFVTRALEKYKQLYVIQALPRAGEMFALLHECPAPRVPMLLHGRKPWHRQ